MNLFVIVIKSIYTATVIATVSIFLAFYSLFSLDSRFFSITEQYKDPIIKGKIHASFPNLGAIIVHFERPSSKKGSFLFQMQEINSNTLHYSATYALQDIYNLQSYPFGFPVIVNSQNKSYFIKMESQHLSIKKSGVVYEMIYPFDKGSLFRGERAVQFILGKIEQYWKDLLYSNNLIFYLAPTFFFLFFTIIHLIFKDKFQRTEIYRQSKELAKPTFLSLLLFIGYDILFIPKINDLPIALLCMMWALLIFSYRYKSQKSFVGALFFLILCPILLVSNMGLIAEKASAWAFMFMVMGTIHALIELKNEEAPNENYFIFHIHQLLNYIPSFDSALLLWYKKMTYKKQKPITIKVTLKDYIHQSVAGIKEYVLFFLYVMAGTVIILTVVTVYTKVMSVRDRKLKNPVVQLVEPKLVYPATKVLLFGSSFGSRIDERYRLMKDGVEVRPDYWEDHKIIFTIPLGWKTGIVNIWIERPIQWNGETIIEITKPVQIKLLPISGWNSPDDDLYFEQMKTWKKETREINGYN
ncbi:MAG: hypothetical protein NTZ55_04925 [Candidatus Roizmanbacteria bacterium]|nr:hypothetical protein [Candidatus Roizmanbacteria bacterium]